MQNDMRDRLVELLSIIPCNAESCSAVCDGRCQEFDDLDRCQIGQLADHLIANGVIVTPCKVGDIVWSKGAFTEEIYPFKVCKVGVCHAIYHNPKGLTNTREFTEDNIGKTVFLTKDQAEQKLKELSENAET